MRWTSPSQPKKDKAGILLLIADAAGAEKQGSSTVAGWPQEIMPPLSGPPASLSQQMIMNPHISHGPERQTHYSSGVICSLVDSV